VREIVMPVVKHAVTSIGRKRRMRLFPGNLFKSGGEGRSYFLLRRDAPSACSPDIAKGGPCD